MRGLLVLGLVCLSMGSIAFAGELDNESSSTNVAQRAQAALPTTVVVRVNLNDQTLAVLQSGEKLAAAPLASDAGFTPVQADQKLASELDRDSSTDSWFFFNGCDWNAPAYYYYGYTYYYQPYFNYTFGNYAYYYYWYRW